MNEVKQTMGVKTKAEVQQYATAHSLEERLSAVVNKAIAAGSPDPIAYIAALLSNEASKDVVDYKAVKAELLAAMDNPSWDDGSLAPIFIRLAWHSSGTYDKASGTGGPNGAGRRGDQGDSKDVVESPAGLINLAKLLRRHTTSI